MEKYEDFVAHTPVAFSSIAKVMLNYTIKKKHYFRKK